MAGPTSSSGPPTRKVTITLPGNHIPPPVYIAGSFTKEPWLPEEMVFLQGIGGSDSIYSKIFHVPPGEHQYKFRRGHGDWWILDERNKIVKDAAGNSNNLLVIPHDKDPSVKDSAGIKIEYDDIPDPKTSNHTLSPPPINIRQDGHDPEESAAADHEGFLGTWEPNSEISPAHRRASTSLGFRISRIGTFMPPEATAQDLKNAEVASSAGGQKTTLDLPTNNNSHTDDDEEWEDEIKQIPTAISNSFHGSTGKSSKAVPSLDRTMEMDSAALATGLESPGHHTIPQRLSDLQGSYGTITAHQPAKSSLSEAHHNLHAPKLEQAASLLPALTGTMQSRTSVDTTQPLLENKPERQQPEDESKNLAFFVMIAAWFKRFWNWLFGARQPAEDDHARID